MTMVWVVSRSRLKALLATHLPIYHPSHRRDNVTAPHGHPKLRSRLHFRRSQEGGNHESSYEHVVALEKKYYTILYTILYHTSSKGQNLAIYFTIICMATDV